MILMELRHEASSGESRETWLRLSAAGAGAPAEVRFTAQIQQHSKRAVWPSQCSPNAGISLVSQGQITYALSFHLYSFLSFPRSKIPILYKEEKITKIALLSATQILQTTKTRARKMCASHVEVLRESEKQDSAGNTVINSI